MGENKICGDLKVIGLHLGMQSGCTKFCSIYNKENNQLDATIGSLLKFQC